MERRQFLKSGMLTVGTVLADSAGLLAALDSAVIGANVISGLGFYESLETLRKLGFRSVEIHPMGLVQATPRHLPGFYFDRLTETEKRKIQGALKGFQHLSFHLPWVDWHPFSHFPPIAEFSIQQLKIALEAVSFFGAELANAHVARSEDRTWEEVWPEVVQRFREWGDLAAKGRFRLTIETGGGSPPSVRDFVRLIREIEHPSVGCTVDVGHEIYFEEFQGQVKPADRSTPAGLRAYNDIIHRVIDQLGDKIFHLHVHDIDPGTWTDHHPIGTGVIDFPRLISKLNQMQYKGLLILEIAAPDMVSSLADSKQRLEQYLAG
jgi:sugar phosphate isomerase/epimerase